MFDFKKIDKKNSIWFTLLSLVLVLVLAAFLIYFLVRYKGYEVKFDADNGSDIVIINIEDGKLVSQPDKPEKTGYTFVAWYIKGTDKEFDFNEQITETTELVAKWTAIEYTITFMDDQTVLYVQKYTIEDTPYNISVVPIKEGYSFEGWYQSADYSGTAISTLEQGSHGDKVLFIKWK